jgi:hypothetical protein
MVMSMAVSTLVGQTEDRRRQSRPHGSGKRTRLTEEDKLVVATTREAVIDEPMH